MKNHDTALFRSNYFYIMLMEIIIIACKILSMSDPFRILFVLLFAQDDSVLQTYIYIFFFRIHLLNVYYELLFYSF